MDIFFRTKYRKYKELYKKSLKLSPDHESIKSKLRELEEGLDVCNIVIAREQAKAEVMSSFSWEKSVSLYQFACKQQRLRPDCTFVQLYSLV